MKEKLLIIFAKNPLKDNVKTRLGKTIGFENARNLYIELLTQVIEEHKDQSYDLKLYVDGQIDYFEKFTNRKSIILQSGKDIGIRMLNALKNELKCYKKVILIGSDIPDITIKTINKAFSKLNNSSNLVIGPSYDGGYYLIGMNRFFNIFEEIQWSSSEVFSQTLKRISNQKISFDTINYKIDIDNESDLKDLIYNGILNDSYKKYLRR